MHLTVDASLFHAPVFLVSVFTQFIICHCTANGSPECVKGDARAELTWFPVSRTQLKLCWQVLFTSQ
jgi:hypothetical protein